jgi:CheY-like chemotaxis protein
MSGPLDVLVVDDRPESISFLTEFLLGRCRRVDVATSVREATIAITRRKAAGEPYLLVISDFVMPEADGLALLRDLRQRQDDTPFVFITGYRALNPALESEAQRQGVLAILDKPVDLRQVEAVLSQTTAFHHRRKTENEGAEPFFGTSRTMRRGAPSVAPPVAAPSAALEPRKPAASYEPRQMPATGRIQRPADDGGALQPRRPVPSPLPGSYEPRPIGQQPINPATAGFSRGLPPVTSRLDRLRTPLPQTSMTARVRRGVDGTGSFTRKPPVDPSATMPVRCATCDKEFVAVRKPESYTTVCVHCGQLQRIPAG